MKFFLILISILLLTNFSHTNELPSNPTSLSGEIAISSSDTSMTVHQNSNKAIIEWNSFNIGENNTVTFNQPSTNASALNRVISGNPTTLAGVLNANGKLTIEQ